MESGRIVSLKLLPIFCALLGHAKEIPPFCADYALMNSTGLRSRAITITRFSSEASCKAKPGRNDNVNNDDAKQIEFTEQTLFICS